MRRYGLADWLSQLRVDFIRDWIKDDHGVPLSSYSRATRIRMAFTELGPTFIKLGQVLSLRPELIGAELATELTRLQSDVPADSPDRVRATIEKSLGKPVDELFASFDDVAIASASIGQVHRARLHDGTEVVVKVQHASIEAKVHEDLEIMAGLAQLAMRLPDIAVWKPQVLVEQLSRSLKRELDFTRELQNLLLFGKELARFKDLRIPRAFPELSSSRVLTMEYIEGVAVNKLVGEDKARHEQRQAIAKLTAEIYVEMIFTLGAYHADPHPGNVLVVDGNKLGLLDFGMVGRIDDRLRESIEEMTMAVIQRDASVLTSVIKRVGQVPPRLEESLLAIDVAELVDNYGTQSLESFDLAGALNDITEIMHRHQIVLPPQTSLLIKMLISLEGTLHQLAPEFSLIEVMQPFFRRIWLRRLSPVRQLKRMRRFYLELESLAEKLPNQVTSVMQLIQEGRLDVHLAHKGLSPSVNRLVLGMLISSVFLGSSLLLSYQVPPLLFLQPGWLGIERLSLFGLIGYALSILAGIRLIMAINRSGHLDQRDSD